MIRRSLVTFSGRVTGTTRKSSEWSSKNRSGKTRKMLSNKKLLRYSPAPSAVSQSSLRPTRVTLTMKISAWVLLTSLISLWVRGRKCRI